MVGHKIRNLTLIDRRFSCSMCFLLLKIPLKLSNCGHHLCQSCFIDEEQKLTIVCRICNVETSRENVDFDREIVEDMLSILIECSLCEWIGVFKEFQKHLEEKHTNSMCEFCKKLFLTSDELTRHDQDECSMKIIECPLPQIGCQEKFRRSDLHQHFLSSTHQIFLSTFIRKHFPSKTSINELRQILLGFEYLSQGIELVNDEIRRIKNENFHRQVSFRSLEKEIYPLSKSIEEKSFAIEKSKLTDEIIGKELRSIREMTENFALNSFDGTFIWKIENIREKIAEAQSNIQTSFYSPPFYSSRTGYKMCLRLYPTGDGNCRGTHLSLFFVLMRSEFDGILKYPFCFKVFFCLCDQTGRNEHIIDSFRPDPHSNSFQRPRSQMNIASGLPKFVPLEIILQDENRFIRDNTIFIRVFIDFENLSQENLEELFRMSPSIPHPIGEITRRQTNNDFQQI